MFRNLFGSRPRRDYWQASRAREASILVLGRLGWTIAEIAAALGVTPSTVRQSVAVCLLYHERGGRDPGRGAPRAEKLRATIVALAQLENQVNIGDDERRVREALRQVLANVKRR